MRETKIGHPDYILFSVTLILIFLGIIILASVSAHTSQEKFNSPNFYLFRYLLFGLLPGILFGFIAYKISWARWRKLTPILLSINLLMLALVFFPIVGIKLGGASRWINLGVTSLQPSEFLKLTFILYLANWLPSLKEKHKKNISNTLLGFLMVAGLIAFFLIMQPDISTLGLILACGILIYFVAGTPLRHTMGIIFGGVAI